MTAAETKDQVIQDADVAKKEVKRSNKIMPTRFNLAEYERSEFIANVEQGVTLDDIQQPEFWSYVAPKLRPFDHIEVRAEDGSWMAELLVLGTDRQWARVKVLTHHQLTTGDVSQTQAAKHVVEWKGPQRKFCVIRTEDSAFVKEGFSAKEEAQRWMIDHEKVS